MTKSKGKDMNIAMPAISKAKIKPPVRSQSDKLLQAELEPDLLDVMEEERTRLGLTKKAIVEWGVKAWLLAVNPEKARKYFDRVTRRQGLKEE
jgi:hypothetical protein